MGQKIECNTCGKKQHRLLSRARARAHAVDVVEPDDRRRGIDRVHDIVERTRQRVDVFAVQRRNERAVQTLDDLVGEEVALMLDFLDFVGLVGERRVDGEHRLEQTGAAFAVAAALALLNAIVPPLLAALRLPFALDHINLWVLDNQWQGSNLQATFFWLREQRGLVSLGRNGYYQLYRVAP